MNINNLNIFGHQPIQRKDNPDMTDKMLNFHNGVMPTVRELICSRAEREVPENGKFTRVYVAFNIPDSENEGFLDINYDSREPNKGRCLTANVHHKNSDRIYKHFLVEGTKKEILDYLKNNDNQEQIINSLTELSQKVDEYYSAF